MNEIKIGFIDNKILILNMYEWIYSISWFIIKLEKNKYKNKK